MNEQQGAEFYLHLLNNQLLLAVVAELVGLEGGAVVEVGQGVDVDQPRLQGADRQIDSRGLGFAGFHQVLHIYPYQGTLAKGLLKTLVFSIYTSLLM